MNFGQVLAYFSWGIQSGLGVLTLSAMLKGAWRKYPVLFGLLILDLLSSAILMSMYIGSGKYTAATALGYWVTAFGGQMCLLLLILTLAYDHAGAQRRTLVHALAAGVSMAVILSFAAHSNWHMNMMMTKVSRDVDFILAVANFFLWSILIASKGRDRQTLLVAGGLGLSVTGGAVAHSLRQISRSLVLTGNVIHTVTGILGVLMWWRAFAGVRKTQREDEPERETIPFPS